MKNPSDWPTKRPIMKKTKGWCCAVWDSFPTVPLDVSEGEVTCVFEQQLTVDNWSSSMICSLMHGISGSENMKDSSERQQDDESSVTLDELSHSPFRLRDSVSEVSISSTFDDSAQPSEPHDSLIDWKLVLLLDRQRSSSHGTALGKFSIP